MQTAGHFDEVTRSNIIMPDTCPAIEELLGPRGIDRGLLTDEERANNDTTRLSYTERDKRVLRQYEGAASPSKSLCMVLQEKYNAWSYTLFHVRIALQQTSSNYFAIHEDAIANNQAADLRNRGERNVLVRKAGVNIGDEIGRRYLRVETMDPLVEKYRSLYCRDLSERLSINDQLLPRHLSFGVHLNPLFGTEERIIGSGLMTRTQYGRSKRGETINELFVIFLSRAVLTWSLNLSSFHLQIAGHY